MTRLQRGYVAIAVVGSIIAALYAWSERQYIHCAVPNAGLAQLTACEESPVLDRTALAIDFAYAIGWVALLMFLIWLMGWVLRGK